MDLSQGHGIRKFARKNSSQMMLQLNSMCSRLEVHFVAMSKGLEPVDRSVTKNLGEVCIVPSAVIQVGVEIRDAAIIGVLSFLNQNIPAGFKDNGSPK